ncbi:MAG: serine/threonine protein kinase [Gemmatimonadota bacterium]|nr:MAG: serine/threonine protein kinase [Gemmatimonadota bacterium]
MTGDIEQVTISKIGADAMTVRTPSAQSLPPTLLRLAVRRVQIISVVFLILMFIGWFLTNLLEGELADEFRRVGEWGPAIFIITASFLMLGLARLSRISPATVLAIALVYEVAISWGMAFSTHYDAFQNMPASLMESDIVGFSGVALWMVFFTVMVPAQPGRALVALLLSAISVPVVYLLEVRAGRAPALDAAGLWLVFAGPHLLAVGLAYISARAIYRLGRDVKRAQEMGSYRLVERLGSGGMGEVWRARHRMLVRPAAVKLIHADALGVDVEEAKVLISRFEREAQVTASLQSPHTVELYDFGTTEDGKFYYVMELLEGVDLEQLVSRFGPLPPERVVHVVRQVCASLGEAHRRGLVHRDVKPANVYLCQRAFQYDFVKVLDFGLVKWHTPLPSEEDLKLSQAGSILGTPSYMAPEIARGEGPIDGRADLYAVGCLAYWLLTGQLVFEASSFPAMVLAHANQQPTPPSRKTELAVPASLDAAVLSCLEKKPDQRVQTADELVAQLNRVQLEEPWTKERAEHWWRRHDDGG